MNRLTAISLFAAGSLAFAVSACTEAPVSAPSDPVSAPMGVSAKLIEAPAGAQIIEDTYIVVFRDDVAPPAHGALAKVAASYQHQYPDIAIDAVFQHSFKGFSARIPESRLPSLLNDPRVAYIERDQIVSICSTSTVQSLDWGTSYIGADSSSTVSGNRTGTVSGVKVYVVDTGIDPNHSDLNVAGGINYGNQLVDSTHWEDEHGHGTHVAGIIGAKDNSEWTVGVAPGVELYSVRVFGKLGTGSSTNIIKGLEWIRRQHIADNSTPMVVNMSLSAYANSSLDRAVQKLIDSGITVVVAAGNNTASASSYSPARVAAAITVAATQSNGAIATFSNYGSAVDVLAPGVSILASKMGGGVTTKSGTSMATPQVAGAAALYLSSNSTASPATVASAISNRTVAWGSSLPTGTPNKMLRVNGF